MASSVASERCVRLSQSLPDTCDGDRKRLLMFLLLADSQFEGNFGTNTSSITLCRENTLPVTTHNGNCGRLTGPLGMPDLGGLGG